MAIDGILEQAILEQAILNVDKNKIILTEGRSILTLLNVVVNGPSCWPYFLE